MYKYTCRLSPFLITKAQALCPCRRLSNVAKRTAPASASSQCDCTHQDSARPLEWPTQLPQPIDYTSPLLKVSEYTHHFLITTPDQGAHDWVLKDSTGAPVTLPSRIAAAIRGAKKERSVGQVLVNYVSKHLSVTRQEKASDAGISVQILPAGYEVAIPSMDSEALVSLVSSLLSGTPAVRAVQLNGPQLYICGHLSRDARCGLTAPSLVQKSRQVLAQLGRGGQVMYISHVGGHKFAGNLIIYVPVTQEMRARGSEKEARAGYGAVWYGRVNLENVERIIRETLDGKVISENMRLRTGRFDAQVL